VCAIINQLGGPMSSPCSMAGSITQSKHPRAMRETGTELGLSLRCHIFLHYGPSMQWHSLMNMGLNRNAWMRWRE